jgi:hypothetical protein
MSETSSSVASMASSFGFFGAAICVVLLACLAIWFSSSIVNRLTVVLRDREAQLARCREDLARRNEDMRRVGLHLAEVERLLEQLERQASSGIPRLRLDADGNPVEEP